MRSTVITAALVATSLSASGAAWLRWQRALPTGVPDRVSIAGPRAHPPEATDSALAEAEDLTVTNDPFRLANSPSALRFDPASDAMSVAGGSTIPQPRPVLVLKAIVGGPPWQAVIDGIPGQPPGTFAKQGNRFNKLTIRAVTRDSVIVQGADTAWVLSFKGR